MRTFWFYVTRMATHEFIVAFPSNTFEVVHEDLIGHSLAPLRGPRGGAYVRTGGIAYHREEDFLRNSVSFRARFVGRYVRPSRKTR